jgi:isoleucyl-tRNA synthetase
MNYKDTLQLPKTDFPMKADLVKREPEILKRWEAEDVYGQIQKARAGAPTFILHDGPPFANGDVHMGTALNKVLKDLVVKSHSMAGFCSPYLPGWDCHGLPIEFKVVKEARGLSPVEVRQKSEAMARKYVGVQRTQFQRLGIFGEWAHPYLTLDPAYEASVLRAFAAMVDKGLVYQSKKPVYWSTGALTALAEAEVEYQDRISPAIYVKFPATTGKLAELGAKVVIWTTTPWTLPANLGITLHPEFKYSARPWRDPKSGAVETLVVADGLAESFARETGWEAAGDAVWQFQGKEVENEKAAHPFLHRGSLLMIGDHVTLEAGTGCVHTAPGHGADDYTMGRKYGLAILSPVDDLGRFTEECEVPELVGKNVFEANPRIIEILKERGALVGDKIDHHHTYPHCWRSKVPIIFRAVEQFFIRLDDEKNRLRQRSLEAIAGVEWIPAWGQKRIAGTVESRPDWCISRQRSWGVPLPVFYNESGSPILRSDWIEKFAQIVEQKGTNVWFDPNDTTLQDALALPPGTTRRSDTLDVWIDSGVSWLAVVEKMMHHDGPADLYLEATDQHRGWFQSSMVMSVAVRGRAPYKACLTHGFVVDVDTRRKISKSEQGQYAKPTNAEYYYEKYGADIVRLWVSSTDFTDEVPFGEETFSRLTDTYRRIRNTLRILLGNLHGFDPLGDAVDVAKFTSVDAWIMHRLGEVVATCREAYAKYEYHRVYHTINQFCAVDLSALYVDITKDRMYCDRVDSPRRRATQTVMHQVFGALCRLLAPVLVFTAEEAWERFGGKTSIHTETFPEPDDFKAASGVPAAAFIEKLLSLRDKIGQAIEPARQAKQIGSSLQAELVLEIADEALLAELRGRESELEEFFILSSLTLQAGAETKAVLKPSEAKKCARCWRHRQFVGLGAAHPDLCDRCEEALAAPAAQA